MYQLQAQYELLTYNPEMTYDFDEAKKKRLEQDLVIVSVLPCIKFSQIDLKKKQLSLGDVNQMNEKEQATDFIKIASYFGPYSSQLEGFSKYEKKPQYKSILDQYICLLYTSDAADE